MNPEPTPVRTTSLTNRQIFPRRLRCLSPSPTRASHGTRGYCTRKLSSRRTRDTIVGIVGAGYKVFTNQQAVTLCHKFCLEAFPDTTPAEWAFVEGHGSGTRSWAAIDIHHRSHAMNLMCNGDPSEIFPFVRITKSYNGSRALQIDKNGRNVGTPPLPFPAIGFLAFLRKCHLPNSLNLPTC